MSRVACLLFVLPVFLGTLADARLSLAGETVANVAGRVKVDGAIPIPKEWPLDEVMQRFTGEISYREETWLIGKDQGLANCVLTLKRKPPAIKAELKPIASAVLDKVGLLNRNAALTFVLRDAPAHRVGARSGRRTSTVAHNGVRFKGRVSIARDLRGCAYSDIDGHLAHAAAGVDEDSPDAADHFETRSSRLGEARPRAGLLASQSGDSRFLALCRGRLIRLLTVSRRR